MNSDKAQAILNDVDRSIEALAQSTDTLRQSDDWKKLLRVMSTFHKYSLSNQFAILRQRPDATRVAGLYTWNQLGRRVKRGEKGIAILAPMIAVPRKDNAKAEREASNKPALLGFRRVYVWDESQTEGAPLPELEKVTGTSGVYLDRLREYVIAQGISLEFDEKIAPALGMAAGTTR